MCTSDTSPNDLFQSSLVMLFKEMMIFYQKEKLKTRNNLSLQKWQKWPDTDEATLTKILLSLFKLGAIFKVTVFVTNQFFLVNSQLRNNFLKDCLQQFFISYDVVISIFHLKYDFLAFYARLRFVLSQETISPRLSNSSNYFLVVLC